MQPQVSSVPGVRFLPNAITVLALSTGLTSVVFATQGRWMAAMIAIGAAAVLDSLDGPTARLLNSTSRIGAELDSLADLSSFGICPAIMLYLWKLDEYDTQTAWFGWAVCLTYAVCTALRLARFNSLLEDDTPKPFAKGFFTGIPSPPGALLVMVPILLTEQFGSGWWSDIWPVSLWTLFVGILMVSQLPTIALKSVRISNKFIVPMLVLTVLGVAALFFQPRITALVGLTVYFLHLPYAFFRYRYLAKHPELWGDSDDSEESEHPPIRRSGRRVRLTVRMPRRRRVAGRTPDGQALPPSARTSRSRITGRRRLQR